MPRIPLRYVPKQLSMRDKTTAKKELRRSRALYKKHHYYTRKAMPSFRSKPSNHTLKARKVYGLQQISPSAILSKKTGCSLSALQKIVQKGEGAYFSSGSRPNQTAQSWGYARLASAITGGKASAGSCRAVKYDDEKSCFKVGICSFSSL